MTSTGRGGAGNIYEARRAMERQRVEDEKAASEMRGKILQEAKGDVDSGLPPPQRAFLGGRKGVGK